MHRCRSLTTSLRTDGLLCLFLLTLAAVSSGQQPTAADVPALVRSLKDKDAKVRIAAASRLASSGAEARAAVPPLVETLRDENFNVRTCAAPEAHYYTRA
jgi:HEAT repeat protein